MNKYQEALSSICFTMHYRVKPKALGKCEDSNLETLQELVQALAAYENTGLTPGEIMSARTLRGCWIGVEEKLPDLEEKVLCCTATKAGGKNIVIGYYSASLGRWCCGMNSNVIAWMPLPEPYEEEE